jgi:hypothetical protein
LQPAFQQQARLQDERAVGTHIQMLATILYWYFQFSFLAPHSNDLQSFCNGSKWSDAGTVLGSPVHEHACLCNLGFVYSNSLEHRPQYMNLLQLLILVIGKLVLLLQSKEFSSCKGQLPH